MGLKFDKEGGSFENWNMYISPYGETEKISDPRKKSIASRIVTVYCWEVLTLSQMMSTGLWWPMKGNLKY